jgi:hypothetical protein
MAGPHGGAGTLYLNLYLDLNWMFDIKLYCQEGMRMEFGVSACWKVKVKADTPTPIKSII